MKKNLFKKLFNLSWLILAAMLMFTACSKDDDNNDEIVLDGIYITGDATAIDGYNVLGRMTVTKNEVTKENRSALLEKYIAISSTGSFSIKQVAGAVKTTYGPGTDFAVVAEADRDIEEPQVDFWRGSYVASETTFTVPTSGLYHVVIDTELMKIAIAPVFWGVIGAATPEGWSGSTALTPSAFDLNAMTFTISDMELRGGDWKFRYSDGWKIIFDAEYDNGTVDAGIKVNTNFGGAVNALEAGGDNIVNDAPGVYTIAMAWTLATGHIATATKTADLPPTDWTGVICDAVGTGISADNVSAITDPSGWAWGNKLLADGAPVKVGEVYTWTWTGAILEANEGFKLRTENGVAPPSGGANFDAGYSALDVAGSSTLVAEMDGGLSVTAKGIFNITLEIDASDNDAKVITITDAK